jgi:hypothetical protein
MDPRPDRGAMRGPGRHHPGDPSGQARDYSCGTATHDGHDGTDFRLRTTREATRDVAVPAAAAGEITAERDRM